MARELSGRLRRRPVDRAQTAGHPVPRPYGGGAACRRRAPGRAALARRGRVAPAASLADRGRRGLRPAAAGRRLAAGLAAAAAWRTGHPRSSDHPDPGHPGKLVRRDPGVRTAGHRCPHAPPPARPALAQAACLPGGGRGAPAGRRGHAGAGRGDPGRREPGLEAGPRLAPRPGRAPSRQLSGGAPGGGGRTAARRRPVAADTARRRRPADPGPGRRTRPRHPALRRPSGLRSPGSAPFVLALPLSPPHTEAHTVVGTPPVRRSPM